MPDPVLGNDEYKDFSEVYGTETTDQGRPSLLNVEPVSERDKLFKNILTSGMMASQLSCA